MKKILQKIVVSVLFLGVIITPVFADDTIKSIQNGATGAREALSDVKDIYKEGKNIIDSLKDLKDNLTDKKPTGMLPDNWDKQAGQLVKSQQAGGLAQLQDLVLNNIGEIVRYLLISIGIFYAFLNVVSYIITGPETDDFAKVKTNFGNIATGLIFASLASEFAKVFDLAMANGNLGNIGQLDSSSQIVINYLAFFAGGIAVFSLFLIGSQIMIQGEGDAEALKKQFLNVFTGLLFIIFADVIINDVIYPYAGEDIIGTQEANTLMQEVFSFFKYIFGYIAIIAIGMIMGTGIYIMVQQDPEAKDTALTLLKNMVISFFALSLAYTITSFLLSNI